MSTLYIIRGLPGSGKSTLAKKIVGESNRHCESDNFFIKNGQYKFDVTKLEDAHKWCLEKVKHLMTSSKLDVAVSNTFTRQWEYQPYIDFARKLGWNIQIVECNGKWNNVHDVPPQTIDNMKRRWEPSKDIEASINAEGYLTMFILAKYNIVITKYTTDEELFQKAEIIDNCSKQEGVSLWGTLDFLESLRNNQKG